jgi:hypothetical protein
MPETDQPGKSLEVRASLAPAIADLLPAAPGLLRVAASSAWRVASWSVATSVDMTGKTVRALASGQSPVTVAQNNLTFLRGLAREALGIPPAPPAANGQVSNRPMTAAELRARGAELLAQSSDVHLEADLHPAYERILGDLAPDESRILRLLALEGPQPAVDIRTGRPLGIGSELVASGLSMIGIHAGVRKTERTKAYLNNLYRLGLIWFSHETLGDPSRYQVVEVQPEVAAAIKLAGRASKTVRRSILLTPFGEDFCEVCLPLNAPKWS